jgi:hypothetical protein
MIALVTQLVWHIASFVRVGDTVTMSCQVDVACISTGLAQFSFNVPYGLTTGRGSGVVTSSVAGETGYINTPSGPVGAGYADCIFNCTQPALHALFFHFTYTVV